MKLTPLLATALLLLATASARCDSPEEAMQRLEAAFKAGDLDAAVKELAEPASLSYARMSEIRRDGLAATRDLDAAMETRFGKGESTRAWCGIDFGSLGLGILEIQGLKIVDKKADGERFLLTVVVARKRPSGPPDSSEEPWIAVQQHEAWKVARRDEMENAKDQNALWEPMGKLIVMMRETLRDVEAGRYGSGDETKQAMLQRLEDKMDTEEPPREKRDQGEVIPALRPLRRLAAAEETFRQDDVDGNGVREYWTQDVAGLCNTDDPARLEWNWIRVALARADRTGIAANGKEEPKPYLGYWLRALATDQDGKSYRGDSGTARTHPSRFGFCAWPAEYGPGNRLTYIVNETGVVYWKDLGPDAKNGADAWPGADPRAAGWEDSAKRRDARYVAEAEKAVDAMFRTSPNPTLAARLGAYQGMKGEGFGGAVWNIQDYGYLTADRTATFDKGELRVCIYVTEGDVTNPGNAGVGTPRVDLGDERGVRIFVPHSEVGR